MPMWYGTSQLKEGLPCWAWFGTTAVVIIRTHECLGSGLQGPVSSPEAGSHTALTLAAYRAKA